ncbi:FAD-binding domain-containing protein [Streptomyces sp. R44]|uniref:FAD-binding domain-containing protein n=1 Tax=Streptomyces sp. R44 TaxID=3238633 RepID=A0AB39SSD5_9ACTN
MHPWTGKLRQARRHRTDKRPERVLNPVRQGQRHHPDGRFVHRRVPGLKGLQPPAVHQPWTISGIERARYDSPDPLIVPADVMPRFRRTRHSS